MNPGDHGKLPPLLLLHPADNNLVARRDIAQGEREALGHQEFILTCKQFEPIGRACLPAA